MSSTGTLRVVVVGSGRVGLQVTRSLADRGHDVVVLERRSDRSTRLADEYLATVIEGDATRPSVLAQANPERADAIAALTNTPATNLAVCLLAKRLAPDVRTVLRTTDPEEEYREFVDRVVFPEEAGSRLTVNAIVGSEVRSIEESVGDLNVLEIEVAADAPAAGERLDAIRLPEGSLIVSDTSGDRIAGPETELEAGHRYVVATEPGVADEVMNLLRG
jgi:trk system potassium uptake protein TrkA